MHEINKTAFGAFVSQLRKEKGLTQAELAAKLYISNKAVSKWETGVSIPDVGLLVPLAEILDVSVAELLNCRRLEEPLDTEQIEKLVEQAITYKEQPTSRKLNLSKLPAYLLCLLTGFAEVGIMFLLDRWGLLNAHISEMLQVTLVLCPLFGFYFMISAKDQLPKYYDENRISTFSDGPLRMNIPGVRFNNHNWPHIVKAGQRWYILMMTCYPALHIGGLLFCSEIWLQYDRFVGLFFVLGLLFIPMVIAARKHEYT